MFEHDFKEHDIVINKVKVGKIPVNSICTVVHTVSHNSRVLIEFNNEIESIHINNLDKKTETKAKFIKEITVIDPDTKGEVQISIYKLDNGGMIGVDSSFIETEKPVYSPFDKSVEVIIPE